MIVAPKGPRVRGMQHDKPGDSFNVETEFVVVNQARALATAAWLMAQSSVKAQPWKPTQTAKIEGGFVLFPESAPWLDQYLFALTTFLLVLLMFIVRRKDVMDRFVIGGPLYWLGWLSTAAMGLSVVAMGVGFFL